jgi:hypothetical protein
MTDAGLLRAHAYSWDVAAQRLQEAYAVALARRTAS